MTLERALVEQRGVLRLESEVIDHFDVGTDATLAKQYEPHTESLRSALMDEIFHARTMLWVLNDSVAESILTALRMPNQGPDEPGLSQNHGVTDTLMGDATRQEITASQRRLPRTSAMITKVADYCLKYNHLIQGNDDRAVRKTEAHIHDVRAVARLANEGPAVVAFRTVFPHGNNDSDDDESLVQRPGKKKKDKKGHAGRSSKTVRDTDSESDEDS